MRRVPFSHSQLLNALLGVGILSAAEEARVREVLFAGDPAAARSWAETLTAILVDTGRVRVVERRPEGERDWLRLLEPRSGFRFSLRLRRHRLPAGFEMVPLPVEPQPGFHFDYQLLMQLLTDQERLVMIDRVASPRELLERMEQTIQSALGADSVLFRPISQPSIGPVWIETELPPPILPEDRLAELAGSRDHLIHAPDLSIVRPPDGVVPRAGSAIWIGIGDAARAWTGVIEITSRERARFSRDRIAMAEILAVRFEALLTSSVRLQSLTLIDYLTGLYNRAYFEDQFERQLSVAQRREQGMALLIIDIDFFRNFNTKYGLDGGDRALVTVACVLKQELRSSDTIARYGGEEFAVLLGAPVSPDEARTIAERLRSKVEAEQIPMPDLEGGETVETIRISIGGALFAQDGRVGKDLWQAANRMLLRAKATGRNRVLFVGD